MTRHRKDGKTLDLLAWEPPVPTRAFEPEKIRASSLRAGIAKATSAALKECGNPRGATAKAMSDWLGEPVTENMLNTFASEGREDHVPSLIRFLGICHATNDAQRLLQALADHFDLAVIPARYVAAIEEALLAEKIEELQRRKQLSRGLWKPSRG